MNNLPSSSDDDALDALLKSPRESIPDDGFSARVLAALPKTSPVRSSPANRQHALVTVAAVAGLAVAFLRSGFSPVIELQKASQGIDQGISSLANVDASLLCTAVLVIGVSLFFAFQREIIRALESI